MDVSQQHLFETIRHGHAICLDRIDPNRSIANGFWSRDQMAVVLARVKALEAGLAEYGRHKDGTWGDGTICNWAMPGRYPGMACTCGFAALAVGSPTELPRAGGRPREARTDERGKECD